MFILLNNLHKIWNDKQMNLRRKHFLLTCRWVIWSSSPVSNNTGDDAWIPEFDLKKSSSECSKTKTSSSPLEPLHSKKASKHPHSYFSSCWCSLLIRSMSSNSDVSFNKSKPLSQLWNYYGPLLRLSSHSSAHFNNMVGHEIQHSALYIWICKLGLMYWVWRQTACGTRLSLDDVCQEVTQYTSRNTMSSCTIWLLFSILQQRLCKSSTHWCQPQSALPICHLSLVSKSYGQTQYII